MSKKASAKTILPVTEKNPEPAPENKEFMFVIPPGANFNDIYITTAELARQLGISKKKVLNMKNAGYLSHTCLAHTLYFYKQEIAAMMEKSRVNKTKTMLWVAVCTLGKALQFLLMDDLWLPVL